MRVTSIGHAGMLVETSAGSILCDPWFEPAFFGSWFPFPRNDQLDDDLTARIESADFLYVSHLHGDHHDETWLSSHLRRDIPILLPDFPTREQRRTLQELGFTNFIRTTDTAEHEIAPGLRVAIHVESSITDGPGGDSALVVMADGAIVVDQNDCRTGDLGQLRSHGPVDLHWLQFSGAIWYPMVYEMAPDAKAAACRAKVKAQFARAMRYVEKIDARAVVPSAGPPCFLDPELFGLNMIDGDEATIFPDQTAFLSMLAEAGRRGVLNIPGTTIEVGGDRPDDNTDDFTHDNTDDITATHPIPDDDVEAIFTDKRAYLRRYQADWTPWLDELKAGWTSPSTDLLAALQQWWEPLLEIAPTIREQVGGNVLLRAMGHDDSGEADERPTDLPPTERPTDLPPTDLPTTDGDPTDGAADEPTTGVGERSDSDLERLDVLIDFPAGEVRQHAGEPYSFRFDIDRRLVETVAARRAVDWSNSLLLSCRFVAWRDGDFNEYVYNFFKSLSRERMRRAEAEAVRKISPPDAATMDDEPDIRIGNHIVQRRCPHRQADLNAFGEIDGCEFVCTLHGWRFDLDTGACLTSPTEQPLRIRRADSRDQQSSGA